MHKELVFIYELQHLDALVPLTPQTLIVALDPEIELALERRGIAFISAKPYRDPAVLKRMQCTQQYVRDLFGRPEWDFFTYRSVRLGSIFAFALREYLNGALYATSIFAAVAKAMPAQRWHIYTPPGRPPQRGGPLARLVYDVWVRAAQVVAAAHGIEFMVHEMPQQQAPRSSSMMRPLAELGIRVYNVLISLMRRPQPMRLVVSDHWRNISSFVTALRGVELLMTDRSELRDIPWHALWRFRIRFVQLETHQLPKDKAAAQTAHAHFLSAMPSEVPPLEYRGANITALVSEAAVELVVHASPTLVRTIQGAYRALSNIHMVLLRTSTGGQTHFGALAYVAKACGVPALEQQHGLEYLGPGSISYDHAAEYLAIYGPAITKELLALGYNKDKLIEVGAARFDRYAAAQPQERNTVLCIAPDIFSPAGMDAYDCVDYFAAFFAALPAHTEAVVKLRGSVRERFYRDIIERTKGQHRCTILTGSIAEALAQAHVVVSCYSTVILEAMAAGIPIIIEALDPHERELSRVHFGHAQEIVPIAQSVLELSEAISALQSKEAYAGRSKALRDYARANYRLDGRSAQRLAEYIQQSGR